MKDSIKDVIKKVGKKFLSKKNIAILKKIFFKKNPGDKDPLKVTIRKIWEKVLEKEYIAYNDQFSDLGGDNSKTIEVVFYLEQELQMELPVEIFIMTTTIDEMAYAVRALKRKTVLTSKYLSPQQILKLQMNIASLGDYVKDDSLMVKINEEGKLPPLFWCFNAPGREALALAKQLPKDQPLYAMVSTVTLGRSPETLDKLVSHYVDEMLSLYPDGPFNLAGNCRGAKVICEIMSRLQEKGKKVERLCIMESFNPKLFDYTGKLVLIYGTTSELQRQKLFNWGEEGWEKQFVKLPDVFFIDCAHGQFFFKKNIGDLGGRVNYFLN